MKKIKWFIISIIICLLITEFICFAVTTYENVKLTNWLNRNIKNKEEQYNYKIGYHIMQDFPVNKFYASSIKRSDKKPILWFGCSYAAGYPVKKNRSYPCDKLSDLTGRSCINRAQCSTGIQYVYNQIITKKIAHKVDFIIYIYIHEHIGRLYNYQISPLLACVNLRYKYKNNKLVKINSWNKYLYISYFVQRLKNLQIQYQRHKEQINFILFNHTIEETAKKFKELYPNAKFIMIEFNQKGQTQPGGNPFLPEKEIKILNSYGIEVFKIRDYIGNINIEDDKYWLEDNVHPKAELWDIILPELVKKYNI